VRTWLMVMLPAVAVSPVGSWRLVLLNCTSLPPKPNAAPQGRCSQAGAFTLAAVGTAAASRQ
jgi:hypothetical protein